MFLLLTFACSTAPEITSVSPAEALPGATLRIMGEDLPATATYTLVADGKEVPLGELPSSAGMVVETTVPEGATAGTWTVRVSSNGTTAELAQALTVPAVPEEKPCAEGFTMRSEVSRTRKEVAIDRFGPDDFRETTRLGFDEVERIEYELRKLGDDVLCSSIYVRATNGRRWPIDEDREVNLAARAYRIGSTVGRPTEVTHADLDVSEDPRPGARE